MALTDRQMRQPTAADGAMRVRRLVVQTVSTMQQSLTLIQQVVNRHGRAAVGAELGADASQLEPIYNKLRACLADIDPSRKAPDLPK